MKHQFHQILLVISTLWLSWLVMTAVHEGGHVLGALCTGGSVRRVVWHPAVLSRTEVQPNPHALAEVWAGPVVGSIVPALVALLLTTVRWRIGSIAWAIAGFSLIANGAYIGLGVFDPVGDAREMLLLQTPRWLMAAFGLVAVGGGLWIWHRASRRFGFGGSQVQIGSREAYLAFALALLVTAAGAAIGDVGS